MARQPPYFKRSVGPSIDLHCHSTCSDGTLAPSAIVRLADELGLRAVALTDHDSLAGLPEFLATPVRNVLCVGGVELSCSAGMQHVHLVGLCAQPDHPPLVAMLQQVREWRRERNREMLSRLVALGLPADGGELARLVEEGDVVGRPHLAAALVEAGACATVREAFSRYLRRGRPGYVARRIPALADAIAAVRGAGGVSVWAHPLTASGLTVAKFGRLAAEYAACGLDGIEAYYPEFNAHQTSVVRRVASSVGLLLSGGSDFHGDHMPDISLGTGYGGLHVPAEILPPLLERARERGGLVPGPHGRNPRDPASGVPGLGL